MINWYIISRMVVGAFIGWFIGVANRVGVFTGFQCLLACIIVTLILISTVPDEK